MSLKSSSLLIVDDDRLTTSLLEFVFSRQQVTVTALHDGQSASGYIESHDPVDVVLMEVLLPQVNGFELLEDMRRHPTWKDTKVVMLSAKESLADIQRAFALGADDYLVKPIDPQEVLARVGRFFMRRP
jgi:DNA-binding response OmpR family regulator